MWRSAIKATQDNAPLMAVVLPPINQVIDMHSVHLAMVRRHMPFPIVAVLLGTAAIGVLVCWASAMVVRAGGSLCLTPFTGRSWGRSVDDYRPGLSGIGIIRLSNLSVVETLAAMN